MVLPGAVAFRRRRGWNKERGGWWLCSLDIKRSCANTQHSSRAKTGTGTKKSTSYLQLHLFFCFFALAGFDLTRLHSAIRRGLLWGLVIRLGSGFRMQWAYNIICTHSDGHLTPAKEQHLSARQLLNHSLLPLWNSLFLIVSNPSVILSTAKIEKNDSFC